MMEANAIWIFPFAAELGRFRAITFSCGAAIRSQPRAAVCDPGISEGIRVSFATAGARAD
jgi:hypothetical protein